MSSDKSRFSVFDVKDVVFKDKSTKEIISSKGWNSYAENLDLLPKKTMVIPAGLEGRPDLISYHAYGIVDYWWVVCVANNIIDPFEQLKEGKQIKIPLINN